MLRKEFVQHVEAEIGGAENTSIGKWSLHVKCQLDQVLERAANFLQIRFDVCKDGAPLRCSVANGAASLLQRIIVLSRGRVARQKNVSFRTRDDRGLSPRPQALALELLARCTVHL